MPTQFFQRCLPLVLFAVLAIGCQNGRDVRGPFEGQIVDAADGKPIEGAVVVVVWTHLMNYFEGGRREVDAREAITDAEGRWQIPERPTPLWEGGIAGVRRRFYVFASGYEVQDPAGTPRDQYAPRESTVTTMRRLTTREERCKAAYASAALPALRSHAQIRRYADAVTSEREALQCQSQEI
jgi:hypothetical protein